MAACDRIADDLIARVLNYIMEHRLISSGDSIVVAVSGGADSVCLLHLLHRLSDTLNFRITVAHLDHGLRGADGEADASYVKMLASELKLPVITERADTFAWQRENRLSLEEAAREVRYRFLSLVARKTGATAVAVGHTLNDHVETVILHLIRGTGIIGLQGLRPETCLTLSSGDSLRVIRPLLRLTRMETASYCQLHHLNPRTDMSNTDRRYLRNFIRMDLLPAMRQVNPEVDLSIARMAETVSQVTSWLQEQAEAVWYQTATTNSHSVSLNKQRLMTEHPAIQSHVLRMAIIRLLGESRDFSAKHFEALRKMLSSPAGRNLHLPHEIRAVSRHDSVLIYLTSTTIGQPAIQEITTLQIPGETVLPGWRVTATISNQMPDIQPDPTTAVFDLDITGKNLTVSGRRPGDRFQPLGMPLPKKLQDFMVDNHIPRELRDTIPIVRSGEDIVWVVGYRIGHRYRVTADTKNFLTLKFQPAVEGG